MELVRLAPVRRFRLGASTDLLHFEIANLTKILPRRVADALCACDQFKTAAAHAASLHGVVDDPQALLAGLDESGGLISYHSIVAPLRQSQTPDTATSGISCLAIPTSNRPEQLLRALSAYCASGRNGRERNPMRIFVSDNSACCPETLATKPLQSAAGSWPVYYAGPQEKIAFISALQTLCEAPRPLLEFALLGLDEYPVRTGANRNAILLHSLGELVLSVDDDTAAQPGALHRGEESTTLTFGGNGDHAEFWFFTDRAAALAAPMPLASNILTEHERLLGNSLPEICSQYPAERIRFRDADYGLLQSLARSDGQVRATFSGVAGDSGMHSTPKLALHSGESTMRRLNAYAQAGADILQCRNIARQWLSATVCGIGAPMTTATGLDNRAPLPPFLPVCRNQDEVFGAALKRCLPSAFCGHLPLTIAHDPEGQRSNETGWPSKVRLSDLILECIFAWSEPVGGKTALERMTLLGRHFRDIGELAPAPFEEFVRALLVRRGVRLSNSLEARLASAGDRPAAIRDHIAAQLEELRRALARPAFGIALMDVCGSPRLLLNKFGQLLYWWPEITAATSKLRERGLFLGRALGGN